MPDVVDMIFGLEQRTLSPLRLVQGRKYVNHAGAIETWNELECVGTSFMVLNIRVHRLWYFHASPVNPQDLLFYDSAIPVCRSAEQLINPRPKSTYKSSLTATHCFCNATQEVVQVFRGFAAHVEVHESRTLEDRIHLVLKHIQKVSPEHL